jgi:hypothetical protein
VAVVLCAHDENVSAAASKSAKRLFIFFINISPLSKALKQRLSPLLALL